MANFATVEDVSLLWRQLTTDETLRTEALLTVVSDTLRLEAEKVGKDLDQLIIDSVSYASVLKAITVDIVARTLMTPTTGQPTVQESQSALGYTWSGTYLSPGGGLFIKDSELKRLGLKRQKIGGINIYGEDTWNTNYPY
ncbi:phage Gp19/Gp15/Gp42 family protein [Streptococcus uberis]|uniref:phage Gp19/Gp15/Gp42 family protein n=1 Tax=Streptococcus uberis TaxID=1349 RepID=UPI001FF0E635|nr:phage Gp19/Gp15/Gp42 family protein [Streptococcus uberis]MCK1219598.1 phage Gp19/Gp15/Gp42 family protein [Streptococcus uberis]